MAITELEKLHHENKILRDDLQQARLRIAELKTDFHALANSEPTRTGLIRFIEGKRPGEENKAWLERTQATLDQWGGVVLYWAEDEAQKAKEQAVRMDSACRSALMMLEGLDGKEIDGKEVIAVGVIQDLREALKKQEGGA